MKQPSISIRGARAHNLKGVDIEIPKNKLVVMTGLSGSGKSSLAFDTIYAEGQRRYVESLSAYARQFLGQMDKPDVDSIEGLSPAISIDQKTTSKNPRSTVATVTEIYDYIRLLYARVGKPYCPNHGIEIESQTVQQMTDRILDLEERTKIQLLAPVVSHRKGSHEKLIDDISKKGYVRVRVDGEITDVNEVPELDKNKNHSIEVVVDRLVVKSGIETRLADSIETALQLSEGTLIVDVIGDEEMKFSENHACPICGFSIGELEPRMFSFNSPFGACPTCDGLGQILRVDLDLVVPDPNKTLNEGAILPWEPTSSDFYPTLLKRVCEVYKIDMDKPYKKLTQRQKDILMYGSKGKKIEFMFRQRNGQKRKRTMEFEGVVHNVNRRYHESPSEYTREMMSKYMTQLTCQTCHGKRLSREALSVYVGNKNIGDVVAYSIGEALNYYDNLELSSQDRTIADQILKEIYSRLKFLYNVGLEYLTLDRSAGTLSGGEAQRIRLATQIGSRLTGVLYVLDEPSIGLHQRDNDRLINTLKEMRDLGNTLIVVEHDDDTMRAADYLIDVGPGAGEHGGEIVASGTPKQVMRKKSSLTGQYLSGQKLIEVPEHRREITDRKLHIKGARSNNLKDVNVDLPLSTMTVVTGVSGSGKSSLVNEVLYKTLSKEINNSKVKPGDNDGIDGLDQLDKVIDIDQSPIGRTPRSNPATYTGVFDDIRDIFAQTNEAKIRGYSKGRFSFNVKGGRCEACKGDGIIKIEMHFLPDVYVPCEVCDGKRYNRETLEVTYKGKNIADVLAMTAEEATHFFENVPKIHRKLKTLVDVGLGYVKLGQPATTLSGGEAQRVKLASELHKRSTGRSIYILDEPTTGLHVDDIRRLLNVLNKLVDNGDTVVIIEHNLDVIKKADYLIDLGPEGGDGGGTIVATGTPEEVAEVKESYTGQYLKPVLERDTRH
ncbi:excinuclease ABC subunit UvrA [Staphylococcus pettenkoferi]|uniref:excinuclease ABC subunit UvrA n=1 Tax=Staphylococcus pettenkoferi TaxID=170573 RepID=UPI00066A95DE|nr:excinuclease ABC subunit UvrA [Staphylococcus pettenkoferi]MCI2804474.1 excinuclease ABC subunit UvrA [Staphylococcus pettenkoferi]MCY1573986.1 excinuclease ABC subunit UvrA [Staphylococcus pettenkoferi]MCY1579078.1 excinuclease ABC subunit UvrA [Staphylococcus pettenkoferi]MCY1585650.1 excinuclease ABC subunit UvrA [Staphylococcus pettenkoferi]MCY1625990.1 excinuclease ABC subunit UvrA [Staphylococcus pettenkoferi]